MFLNEEFLKLYEELSDLYNTTNKILLESKLNEAYGNFLLGVPPQRNLDTSITVCEKCGAQFKGSVGEYEYNDPSSHDFGYNSVLYKVFGKHICYDCIKHLAIKNFHAMCNHLAHVRDDIEDYRKTGNTFWLDYALINDDDMYKEYYDAWEENKDSMQLLPKDKTAIEDLIAEKERIKHDPDYLQAKADAAAQAQANWQKQQAEDARKTQLRQPKKSTKKHQIVYATFYKYDSGYEISVISTNSTLVTKVFREDAIGFLECCSDADQRIFLIAIDLGYIKDKRFLDLVKKYLESDTFPVDLEKDEEDLIAEYKDELQGCSFVKVLEEFGDTDGIEAAYDAGFDIDNATRQEWHDFIEDYINSVF